MKNKRETIILITIIVILATYIIIRKDRNINYEVPELTQIERTDITKITYNNFTISREGDNWIIPSGYKASTENMNDILSAIENLKIIDMISESKDYKRFELDKENKLLVYNNEETLLEINIGGLSSTGNYTYITVPGNSNVYSIRGNLSKKLVTDEDQLRDKTVLSFNDTHDITLTKDGNMRALTKDEIESVEVYLNGLKANNFKDLDREEPLLTVAVKDETEHTLVVYPKIDGLYPATSSDVDYPFTLSEYTIKKLEDL